MGEDLDGDIQMEGRDAEEVARHTPLPLTPPPIHSSPPTPQRSLSKRKREESQRAESHPTDRTLSPGRQTKFQKDYGKYSEMCTSSDEEMTPVYETQNSDDLNAMVVPIKRGAKPPYRATPGAAGYDIYMPSDYTLPPQQVSAVPLGLSVQIPSPFYLQLKGRSSMEKKGLHLVAGVIDADYRGEVTALIHNTTKQPVTLSSGQKICQGLLLKVYDGEFTAVDNLEPTERGCGGFGSTGA